MITTKLYIYIFAYYYGDGSLSLLPIKWRCDSIIKRVGHNHACVACTPPEVLDAGQKERSWPRLNCRMYRKYLLNTTCNRPPRQSQWWTLGTENHKHLITSLQRRFLYPESRQWHKYCYMCTRKSLKSKLHFLLTADCRGWRMKLKLSRVTQVEDMLQSVKLQKTSFEVICELND